MGTRGMLSVGSLFSGIGGLDLGLERAGMKVAWQCEIDSYCRKVLKKHWPNVHCYKDVREIDEATPRIDLLCGGFPCQPVSTAGRRQAEADSRWLWPEFARVINLLRPNYVLVENVPGLLTRGMGFVLADLSSIGYDAEWDCVSAASVGALHRRNRVFVVAYTQSDDESGGDSQAFNRQSTRDRRPAEAIGGRSSTLVGANQWETEPDVGRVAYGVPFGVDRLRGLGNAVVPQVAERMVQEIKRVAVQCTNLTA